MSLKSKDPEDKNQEHCKRQDIFQTLLHQNQKDVQLTYHSKVEEYLKN